MSKVKIKLVTLVENLIKLILINESHRKYIRLDRQIEGSISLKDVNLNSLNNFSTLGIPILAHLWIPGWILDKTRMTTSISSEAFEKKLKNGR